MQQTYLQLYHLLQRHGKQFFIPIYKPRALYQKRTVCVLVADSFVTVFPLSFWKSWMLDSGILLLSKEQLYFSQDC